jgi:hypothetical protein
MCSHQLLYRHAAQTTIYTGYIAHNIIITQKESKERLHIPPTTATYFLEEKNLLCIF